MILPLIFLSWRLLESHRIYLRKNVLGEKDEDTLWSCHHLALTYSDNKDYKEALIFIKKVLDLKLNYPYTLYKSLENIFFNIKVGKSDEKFNKL
jgi:hypothetical protein